MFDETLPSITRNVRPQMPMTRRACVMQNLPVVSWTIDMHEVQCIPKIGVNEYDVVIVVCVTCTIYIRTSIPLTSIDEYKHLNNRLWARVSAQTVERQIPSLSQKGIQIKMPKSNLQSSNHTQNRYHDLVIRPERRQSKRQSSPAIVSHKSAWDQWEYRIVSLAKKPKILIIPLDVKKLKIGSLVIATSQPEQSRDLFSIWTIKIRQGGAQPPDGINRA